jgi:DNA-binding beta-propeller fold protein YncE
MTLPRSLRHLVPVLSVACLLIALCGCPKSKVDLTVTVVAAMPYPEIEEDDQIVASIQLQNTGSEASGAFDYDISIDGTVVEQKDHDGLEAGETDSFDVSGLGTVAAGAHTLTVSVDASESVRESSESNNSLDASFTVYGNAGYEFAAKWPELDTYWDFARPTYAAVSAAGGVYINDGGAGAVYAFDTSGALLQTFALSETNVSGIAVGPDNSLYVADATTEQIGKYGADGAFDSSFGGSGTTDGTFTALHSVAVDGDGNVYATDRTRDIVQKFDADGIFLLKWGGTGTGDGLFDYPTGIATFEDAVGDTYIFVSDSGNERIQKFAADGTFQSAINDAAKDVVDFSAIRGLAVDADENVYVADQSGNRVYVFASNGALTDTWGADAGYSAGDVAKPQSIAVSGSQVYVAEDYHVDWTRRYIPRIQILNTDGSVSGEMSTAGGADEMFRNVPRLVVDADDNVYVADRFNHRIQKFDADGVWAWSSGSYGTGNGEFVEPVGLAVSDTELFVADSGNDRVQVLSLDGVYQRTIGTSGTGDGELTAPNDVAISSDGASVFVSDYGTSSSSATRFQQFTSAGVFVQAWDSFGSPAQSFRGITGLLCLSDDTLLVADIGYTAVLEFDDAGVYQGTWANVAAYQMAEGPRGNVFMAADVIRKLDSSGTQLAIVGTSANTYGDGELYNAVGVGVNSTGKVYVADTANNRIQIFTRIAE